tara:strand:- start:256 stop:813 length:558 start_codon:yes stop_codon:yes gene_type:complete
MNVGKYLSGEDRHVGTARLATVKKQVFAQPEQEPEIVRRVRRYAGKRRESVSSPHITAKECIALANWIESMFAQPEQAPKLTDAGADTNIPLWGLEPKGTGLVELHQREQEPVAWAVKRRVATCNEEYAKLWRSNGEEVIPLYTAPPKREWVGLTDDERRLLNDKELPIGLLIEIVESKLRNKNT